MEITKRTRVSHIIKKYGDIASVMEVFGVKSVGPFSIRRLLTKFITVETAAKIHRISPDEFLDKLHQAVEMERSSK